MKIRAFAVLVMSAVIMMAGVVRAQDAGTCFGLSEADCKVISDATNNTLASVTSFNQNWTIDFSATGIPDSANEGQTMAVTFSAVGSGPVLLDLANAAFPLSFDQTVTVNADDGAGMTISAETAAIVVDGILYLNDGSGAWKSLDLATALADSMSGEGTSALPFNPADLMSGDSEQMNQALGIATQLAPLAEVPCFLTYTRDGDTFTFVTDFPTLISAPEFSQILSELSQTGDATVQQAAGIAQILPMVLQEGKITVVQTVDSAANVVTGIDFNIDLSVNAAMLVPTATEPIVVTLKFSVDLTDANGTFDIQAPAESTPLETN